MGKQKDRNGLDTTVKGILVDFDKRLTEIEERLGIKPEGGVHTEDSSNPPNPPPPPH
jgi:hypothetical protein